METSYQKLGKCPFCEGSIGANAHLGMMVHTIPYCKKFADLDPLEFARECNKELAKQVN